MNLNLIDKLVRKYSTTYVAGVMSVMIYALVITLIYLYFNSSKENSPKNYVKKNETKINITLAPQPMQKKQKAAASEEESSLKKKTFIGKKVKEAIKNKPKVTKKPKPPIKKKFVNKKSRDLFKNVKTAKKQKEKSKSKSKSKNKKIVETKNVIEKKELKTAKASELVKSSLKKVKESDAGVENEYMVKVQSLLMGWPTQSEYAGQRVRVMLYIRPSGMFEFEIKNKSANVSFNEGLRGYLEQLKKNGFGRHKGKKTYKIEVEFMAKQ